MSYSDFKSYEDWDAARYYDDDRVQDAQREDAEDAFDRVAWTCSENPEHRWDPHHHPVTRTDPAYVEIDECPICGGQPRD